MVEAAPRPEVEGKPNECALPFGAGAAEPKACAQGFGQFTCGLISFTLARPVLDEGGKAVLSSQSVAKPASARQ